MKIAAASSVVAAIFAAWLAHSLTDARWEVKYQALQLAHAEAVADSRRFAVKVERQARDNSELLAQTILAEMDLEHARGQTTEVEVIRYVESNVAGNCDLDYQWLHAHDVRAAHVSGAAGPSAGAAQGSSGVTEADALQVISANYNLCARAYQQVRWWKAYNATVLEPYRQQLRALRTED